ncbi:hypothetical protein DQ384_23775 [Sphaerisporangium album]|uniref:Antitoxin n=1 Tax=Sphaerisporangium album TaxID=509200 RepID=A0A367FCV5_9ACTN|nr:hypothetical protein [Sphaerisporangium album]RCG28174.1 hypothetical protein DQ384_23775 [Sphaerisporangium album]
MSTHAHELPLAEVPEHLDDLAAAIAEGEVVYLTRNGRRLAAVVAPEVVEAVEAHVVPGDLSALDDLIGSAPGLAEATDLQSLRDEWER